MSVLIPIAIGSRLPLLFAIDAKLGIAEGFGYLPDCSKWKPDGRGDMHCGANLSVGCGGGGASGWGDSWFGSDYGGGFTDAGGSSCGGGGCGGGGA